MLLARGVVSEEPSRFSDGLIFLVVVLLLFLGFRSLLASHFWSALPAY
jgi:hypothetical protein